MFMAKQTMLASMTTRQGERKMQTVQDAIRAVLTEELKMEIAQAAKRRMSRFCRQAALSGSERAALKNSVTLLIQKEKRIVAKEQAREIIRKKREIILKEVGEAVKDVLKICQAIAQRL